MPVTDRRTATDFAELLRWLAEDVYPEAERIVLVVDNRNTHKPAVLDDAFPPERARATAAKFERHDTPKHGSWLNRAAIELSAWGRQCLAQRLDSMTTLRQQGGAQQDDRNDRTVAVRWRSTTADARMKLYRLDPSSQMS